MRSRRTGRAAFYSLALVSQAALEALLIAVRLIPGKTGKSLVNLKTFDDVSPS